VNIQEEFLAKVKENGFEGIGFTCGGFIHQTAKVGSVPYYPNWVNALNIRFLYRIVYEKHTRKRYLKAAIIFPIIFTKDRIKGIYRSLYNL
jgi:N-acetylglucosaminyldiphosphoundecaprenol N-acetyl-beta-D-mannosaminyltransferase